MRDIILSNDMIAEVDEEEFDRISKHSWFYKIYKSANKVTGYAVAWIMCEDGKKRWMFMHRLVLGLKHGDGIVVDHKDDNTLHNYKSNLIQCTTQQNNIARDIIRLNKQSKYKGVCRTKNGLRWRATISFNDKVRYIGTFDIEEDAALAYNEKAIELYGEFARPNIII